MLGSSVRVGTIAGIRIGVHYTWVIIFALMSSTLYSLFVGRHPAWTGKEALAAAVVTSLLFFASVVLHELGHSLVAIARGIRVRSITLFIFGGVAETEKEADSPSTEFWVAIAGPLVSLFLAAVFSLLNHLFGPYSSIAAESFDWLSSINLIIAIFNLVPGFPLDGGRVLRALVWRLTGDTVKGMSWAVVSGRVVAFSLMALGLLTASQTGAVLNGLWLLGIGWFLLVAAEASGQAFEFDRLLSRIAVAEVMHHGVPYAKGDLSIAEWLEDQVLHSGQRVSLVRDNYEVIGLITMSDCRKVARHLRPTTSVREVMTPADQLHTVTPDTDLAEVLRNMGLYSVNQVPVVEGGNVIGWIDRQRILKVLQSHIDSRR